MKRSITAAALAIVYLSLFYIPASATIWHLNPSGPLTIQEAINNAAVGDTILLAPGTYTGPGNRAVDFGGKEVVVASSDGPETTVIDCEFETRAFLFKNGEGPAAVIYGLTIRNGEPAYTDECCDLNGGGIQIINSSPTITGNIIIACRSGCYFVDPEFGHPGSGGAMSVGGGSPFIGGNQFINNLAQANGGAIIFGSSESHLRGNLFYNNRAGGVCYLDYDHTGGAVYAGGGSLLFEDNIFWKNITSRPWGFQIHFSSGDHIIRNCTFVSGSGYDPESVYRTTGIDAGNGDVIESSIIAIYSIGEVVTLKSNIIYENKTICPLFRCNNLFGFSLSNYCTRNYFDNISANPMFVDAANGNFELLPGSPCLPDGNACGVRMGVRTPQLVHVGADSVRVFPGGDVCSQFILIPPKPGIEVAFELFGANSGSGTAYTNYQGEVSWCYPAGNIGIDSVRATAEFAYNSSNVIVSKSIELTLLPPELSVDPAWHTVSDSLVIPPDSAICTHFLINAPIPDIEVEFTASGANTITGSAVTNETGEVAWCYSPNYLGSDTITASIVIPFSEPFTTQARFIRTYLSPQFYFDPSHHGDINTLLAWPGINLCSHFISDPPVEGTQVSLHVRGANHLDIPNAATIAGDGTAAPCYIAAQMGVDTVTATIELDYGGGVYEKSSSLVFRTDPLVFEVHPDYHSSGDTVITSPDATVYTHFRVVPPLSGVNVVAEVKGANQSTMSDTTDDFGHVVFGYPAQQSGVDTITATSEFIIGDVQYYRPASIELIIITDGSTITPVTVLSVDLDSPAYKLLVTLTSNKELDSPTAEFEFERFPGSVVKTTSTLNVDPYGWIYSTNFIIRYPGHLTVNIIASDLFGNDVNESRSCDIASVLTANELDFRSNDGKVGMYAPGGFINKSGYILIERADGWDGSAMDDSGSPLVPASQRFHLSTNSELLGDPRLIVWHTYQATMALEDDLRRIGIYRQSGSIWTYAGGEGDAETVSAGVEIPGVYAAFYNDSYCIVPAVTQLHQNYPNPFKTTTTIMFDLNTGGNAVLTIHDVTGRRIRTLKSGQFPADMHRAEWDGRSDAGETVASGVYFYRLKTGSFTSTKKMVLLR